MDRQERVDAADDGVLAAVEQLEELDDELDVADAAVAGLDLEIGPSRGDRALLDPPLQGLDLGDFAGAQVPAVDEGRDRLDERPAQVQVAGDRAAFDQRLTLP